MPSPRQGALGDQVQTESGGTRQAESLLRDGSPHWADIPFEIYCPRCSYNLRGLTTARCPECGLGVDWQRLLEQRIAGGDFLFEHAWRRGAVRSWCRTVAATLSPTRFWQRVTLYDPIHVAPLMVQLASTIAAALIVLHGLAYVIVWVAIFVFGAGAWRGNSLTRTQPMNPILEQIWLLAHWPGSLDRRYLYLPATIVLGFAGVAAVLYSLHQTLGRCRVKRVHILRVVTYVAPPVLVWVVVFQMALVIAIPRSLYIDWQPMLPEAHGWDQLAAWQFALLISALTGLIAVPTIYLAIALREYLDLPRSWIVSLTTTMVSVLFAYSTLVFAGMFISDKW